MKKNNFFAPGRDLASILIVSARSRKLPGALFGVPGRLWRVSGPSRDVSGTSRDAPETLLSRCRNVLVASGRPERVSGPILSRFKVPWPCPYGPSSTTLAVRHKPYGPGRATLPVRPWLCGPGRTALAIRPWSYGPQWPYGAGHMALAIQFDGEDHAGEPHDGGVHGGV